MTTSSLLPALAVLASLSGALLIAGLVGTRARTAADDDGHDATRNHALLRIGAWWLVAGIAAALGAAAAMATFAAISVLALASYFALAPAQPGDRTLRLACYAAVPVQYLFVATRSFDPFVATLPLVATLGLPLLALRGHDARDLIDRVSACGWGMLACVYCVSHAAAILMLDIPGFAGRNGLLVAFLVIAAKADDLRHCAFAAFARRNARVRTPGAPRIALGVASSALIAAALGAAFASLTPFPPMVAGMVGLLLGLVGALGRFVMSSAARERAHGTSRSRAPWQEVLGRPDAIAFAAPVFFHLLHALYGG
jgi:phosphatidate cytidylyltransferase